VCSDYGWSEPTKLFEYIWIRVEIVMNWRVCIDWNWAGWDYYSRIDWSHWWEVFFRV
jgi:hypothetical protein